MGPCITVCVCTAQDATSQAIRDLFSQFGTIKPQNGAITVKHNGNNNSFAYVDFVDVASAQSCVEAKDLQLNGVTVCFWLLPGNCFCLQLVWLHPPCCIAYTPVYMHLDIMVATFVGCCLCLVVAGSATLPSCHTCSIQVQGQDTCREKLHCKAALYPAAGSAQQFSGMHP